MLKRMKFVWFRRASPAETTRISLSLSGYDLRQASHGAYGLLASDGNACLYGGAAPLRPYTRGSWPAVITRLFRQTATFPGLRKHTEPPEHVHYQVLSLNQGATHDDLRRGPCGTPVRQGKRRPSSLLRHENENRTQGQVGPISHVILSPDTTGKNENQRG